MKGLLKAMYSTGEKIKLTLAAIGIIWFILAMIGSCSGGFSSGSGGSQRCSYCGKVVFNESGYAIHATHKYLNTYECDYCGHSIVKR